MSAQHDDRPGTRGAGAPPPTDASPAWSVWSPERMLSRLAGDRDLACELATIFIAERPRMMEEVRDAIATQSPDLVRRAAHSLKGSTLNFVEDGPAATALALESMGRDGDLSKASETVARLEQELEVLVGHLRRFQVGES